jgi:hypothetical protein
MQALEEIKGADRDENAALKVEVATDEVILTA